MNLAMKRRSCFRSVFVLFSLSFVNLVPMFSQAQVHLHVGDPGSMPDFKEKHECVEKEKKEEEKKKYKYEKIYIVKTYL